MATVLKNSLNYLWAFYETIYGIALISHAATITAIKGKPWKVQNLYLSAAKCAFSRWINRKLKDKRSTRQLLYFQFPNPAFIAEGGVTRKC